VIEHSRVAADGVKAMIVTVVLLLVAVMVVVMRMTTRECVGITTRIQLEHTRTTL